MSNNNEIAFGRELVQLLSRRSLTQAFLAENAKTSQPVISAICNGKRKCGIKLAIKIANALNLSGVERNNFIGSSKRPQWKGFDHDTCGYEAMLYNFMAGELRARGIDSTTIASITQLDRVDCEHDGRAVFVLRDGRAVTLNISIS